MKAMLQIILSIFIFVGTLALGQQNLPLYEVDRERCIGCAQCVPICPVDAIKMIRGVAVIDPQKCIGCGICDGVCPVKAISQESVVTDTGNKMDFVDSIDFEHRDNISAVETESERSRNGGNGSGNGRRRRGGRDVSIDETEKSAVTEYTKTEPKASPETEKNETEPKSPVPSLDAEKCVSCSICARVCPEDAIKMIDGKPVIDPEKCTRCGICIERCPFDALSFPEDK